ELGDLLFVLANVARHLKIDAEECIRNANAKFERRFHYIEEQFSKRGKPLTEGSLEEMEALWVEAKKKEVA
ncbi:MAG: nucleoside triphosphate pyrophosphohydrolase, partial [Alphaproteobacteria bacterium]|nr:nucleoside triphosphate pyrophosphohydrolase [Alphaproteobacteria bacterium]